jgi:hypothetical protein
MPKTLDYTDTLTIVECYKCHISFAMPRFFERQCKQEGGTFWCPAGHPQVYAETENGELKKQLAREQAQRERAETRARAATDQAQASERSKRAYKGQVTKLKNRAVAGSCPCCDRSFPDLAAHMKDEHPGFLDEPVTG